MCGKNDEITLFDVLLALALIADVFKSLELLIAVIYPNCKLTDFKLLLKALERSKVSDFDPKISSHVHTK